MIANTPKAARTRRGQAGRVSPPVEPTRPATIANHREALDIAFAGLCLFAITFMAFAA